MDPLEAVLETVTLHASWLEEARRKGDAGPTVQRWTKRMGALQQAADALRARQAAPEAASPADGRSDLPPDLLAQLSGAGVDRLDDQVLAVLREQDADLGLDALLIAIYRRSGQVHTRKALNNKLYRMAARGVIRQVEGRRGVYRQA